MSDNHELRMEVGNAALIVAELVDQPAFLKAHRELRQASHTLATIIRDTGIEERGVISLIVGAAVDGTNF